MKFVKTYFIIACILLTSFSYAQSYNSYYGSIVNQYSPDSVHANLVQFENLGVKELGTTALANTLDWLINKYTSYGYTDIAIDTFNYSGTDAYNLIVTKTGLVYPNTYFIIDGHYDTKTGTGTNDNGSGVSIILEVARLLQNIPTEYSVKFINFSIEELGLVGSNAYVNNVVIPTNMDIKLLLNIDEVGGVSGMTNNIIVCERDESFPTAANAASWLYTDTLANCVSLYSNLLTEIANAYSSDYMPFQSNNNVITGLFEKNYSPYAHTTNDNLANLDTNYVYEITQATIGASLYFAVAYEPVGIDASTPISMTIKVYPNPAKEILTVDLGNLPIANTTLRLYNLVGELVLEKQVSSKLEKLELYNIPSGIYTLVITSSSNQITKKIVH